MRELYMLKAQRDFDFGARYDFYITPVTSENSDA